MLQIEKNEVLMQKNELAKQIDGISSSNADLTKQMNEFQNSIVKVESESRDSLRQKTELENKIKIQKDREN